MDIQDQIDYDSKTFHRIVKPEKNLTRGGFYQRIKGQIPTEYRKQNRIQKQEMNIQQTQEGKEQ